MQKWLAFVALTTAGVVVAPTSAQHATQTSTLELPLKRGFYVESKTPCRQASNATLSLLRRDGIGGSRYFCEFNKVEKTSTSRYRVTQICTLSPDDAPPDTSVVTYQILSQTSFRTKSAEEWDPTVRYCSQQSLPEPWRNNDIRDLIK